MDGEQFSGWLERQLKRREWSQADFSRNIGVSTGRVSEWLSGKRIPSTASCDRIADVLLLDRDEVLAAAGHRPMDEPLSADDPRRGIIALVRRVDWTPERTFAMRRALEGYIEFDKKGQGG